MENKIKEYRVRAKLTQAELSEKAGVSRTIISQLENGSREIITSETMTKVSKALGEKAEKIFLL